MAEDDDRLAQLEERVGDLEHWLQVLAWALTEAAGKDGAPGNYGRRVIAEMRAEMTSKPEDPDAPRCDGILDLPGPLAPGMTKAACLRDGGCEVGDLEAKDRQAWAKAHKRVRRH